MNERACEFYLGMVVHLRERNPALALSVGHNNHACHLPVVSGAASDSDPVSLGFDPPENDGSGKIWQDMARYGKISLEKDRTLSITLR